MRWISFRFDYTEFTDTRYYYLIYSINRHSALLSALAHTTLLHSTASHIYTTQTTPSALRKEYQLLLSTMASCAPSSTNSMTTPDEVIGRCCSNNKVIQPLEQQEQQDEEGAGVVAVTGGDIRAPGFDGAVGATREYLYS